MILIDCSCVYAVIVDIVNMKRVDLHLSEGYDVKNCEILNNAIVYKLKDKLGKKVKLSGVAHWNSENHKLIKFTIEDVLDFEEIPIVDAIKQLSEVSKSTYSDVVDVDGYCKEIRN